MRWRSLPNYPYYDISDTGLIQSYQRSSDGILLSPSKGNQRGYLSFWMCNEKGRKTMYVHRLVAELFCDKPENATQVNHKDGDVLNNHYTNLEWVTSKQNIQHRFTSLNCQANKGDRNPANKYGEETRQKAIEMYNKGVRPTKIDKELGLSYGYTSSLIWQRKRKEG